MRSFNSQMGALHTEYALAAALIIGAFMLIGAPQFKAAVLMRVNSSIGIINGKAGMSPCSPDVVLNGSAPEIGMATLGYDGDSAQPQECF